MAPLRGWSLKGQRLKSKAPFGHWQTMTFIAALRHDKIEAPCIFDKPINSQSFVQYVKQCLVPVLKPGDIVILEPTVSEAIICPVTKQKRHERLSVKREQEYSFCLLIALSLTQLNKSSQRSSNCYEKRRAEPKMLSKKQSRMYSISLRQTNATTTSKMQGMIQNKIITL